jgi:hypothetical protein
MTFSEACAVFKLYDSTEAQEVVYKESMRIARKALYYAVQGTHAKALRAEGDDIVAQVVSRFVCRLQDGSLPLQSGKEAAYLRRMTKNAVNDERRRLKAFGDGRANTFVDPDLALHNEAAPQPCAVDMADLKFHLDEFQREATPEMAEVRSMACEIFLETAMDNTSPSIRQLVYERTSHKAGPARQAQYDAVRHQSGLLKTFLQVRYRRGQL